MRRLFAVTVAVVLLLVPTAFAGSGGRVYLVNMGALERSVAGACDDQTLIVRPGGRDFCVIGDFTQFQLGLDATDLQTIDASADGAFVLKKNGAPFLHYTVETIRPLPNGPRSVYVYVWAEAQK